MDNTPSHLNMPKRIHEPSDSLNNTFSDGEVTYVIEAHREWWEELIIGDNYRVKSPRVAMYETFPKKLDI